MDQGQRDELYSSYEGMVCGAAVKLCQRIAPNDDFDEWRQQARLFLLQIVAKADTTMSAKQQQCYIHRSVTGLLRNWHTEGSKVAARERSLPADVPMPRREEATVYGGLVDEFGSGAENYIGAWAGMTLHELRCEAAIRSSRPSGAFHGWNRARLLRAILRYEMTCDPSGFWEAAETGK